MHAGLEQRLTAAIARTYTHPQRQATRDADGWGERAMTTAEPEDWELPSGHNLPTEVASFIGR